MIEIHGWAKILESYRVEDDSDEKLCKAIAAIQGKIYEIIGPTKERDQDSLAPWEIDYPNRMNCTDNTLIEFSCLNSSYHLTVMADWNHKSGRWKGIWELFELIADVAPGSYGVVYVRDDEDSDGYENEMQVFVLKKGSFIRRKEPYLSPCIPEIEEV